MFQLLRMSEFLLYNQADLDGTRFSFSYCVSRRHFKLRQVGWSLTFSDLSALPEMFYMIKIAFPLMIEISV